MWTWLLMVMHIIIGRRRNISANVTRAIDIALKALEYPYKGYLGISSYAVMLENKTTIPIARIAWKQRCN